MLLLGAVRQCKKFVNCCSRFLLSAKSLDGEPIRIPAAAQAQAAKASDFSSFSVGMMAVKSPYSAAMVKPAG